MKPKDPQWKILYQAMQKDRRLTALDCFKLCGTKNVYGRMQDIAKQTRLTVYKDWKKVGNKWIRMWFMKVDYR